MGADYMEATNVKLLGGSAGKNPLNNLSSGSYCYLTTLKEAEDTECCYVASYLYDILQFKWHTISLAV